MRRCRRPTSSRGTRSSYAWTSSRRTSRASASGQVPAAPPPALSICCSPRLAFGARLAFQWERQFVAAAWWREHVSIICGGQVLRRPTSGGSCSRSRATTSDRPRCTSTPTPKVTPAASGPSVRSPRSSSRFFARAPRQEEEREEEVFAGLSCFFEQPRWRMAVAPLQAERLALRSQLKFMRRSLNLLSSPPPQASAGTRSGTRRRAAGRNRSRRHRRRGTA